MIVTKQNWFKRSLSLLLTLVICVSMVNVTAFATEDIQSPREELEALLDEIAALNPDDYTAESWKNLAMQANSVVRPIKPYDEETGEGMPDWVAEFMIERLTTLRNELVLADRKTIYEKLEDKLCEAEAMNADNYTEESWANVQDIINVVDRPVSVDNITEKLAEKLLGDLENALSALQEKPSHAISLEDGTYYVVINGSNANWSSHISNYAKIVAKDYTYKVTLYTKTRTYFSFEGGITSNLIYKRYGRQDWLYPEVEVVKPTYNTEFEANDEKFSLKNLLADYDVKNSGYSENIKDNISADYDEMFFDMEYKLMDDNSVAFTFETDELDSQFFINGLYNLTYHNYDGTTSNNYWTLSESISFDNSEITKIPDSISEINGTYVKSETASSTNEAERNLSRNAGVTLEAKDNKIYATYSLDIAAFINYMDGVQSADVYNQYGDLLDVSDGKVTLVYNSIDELIAGKYINIINVVDKEFKGTYIMENEYTFGVDFRAKPVTLTDPTTGIKLYTTSKFVSENAKLTVKPVEDIGSTNANKDPWANAMYNMPKYNKMYFFTIEVTDGDNVVTDFGGAASIDVPKVEGLNDNSIRLFLNMYMSEYNYMAFGWNNNCIVAHDDYYSLLLEKTYIYGNWCIYDEMMSDSDGSTLENGTYTVPITTFNQAQPDQISMSAHCLGETATLVVKDGVLRLEMDFQPVEISDINGYLIQMWSQQENSSWEEVIYTEYYKNEDGSYFTDALNEGTKNYYPKKAYMVLPTTDVQFITKFRVSAMDAIMGDTGDATRDAIFTIYYDEAVKISDDTPEPAPEEIPDFEAADMTKLEALVQEAETYNKDEYTLSTFTIMKNALAGAKIVLANNKATQEEVDSTVSELQDAIDGLVKKAILDDNNNLSDGKYILYAQMLKTDRESFSMSNNAINHHVWLEVVNGEYYLTMQFKGLTIENRFGYLKNLSYYDAGYTYNDYGIPQGTRISAEVISTYDVVDMYNDAENLYPMLLKIKLVDKASVQYVPLHVFVPIMEAIAEGTGEQDVLMQLDWSTLKADQGDIKPEEPIEQSPEVDITDTATGVKIHADKGVFEEGVNLVVTPITTGTDYDNVVFALEEVGKKFKLYEIYFKDTNSNKVSPNGTVTISIPIAIGFNHDNLAVYRINDDGTKTLVKGIIEDDYYKIVTKTGANYALVEKDSTITDNVNNGTDGDNSNSNNVLGSPQTGVNAPQTGNKTNIVLWLMLIFVSVSVMAVQIPMRKRKVTKGK